MIKVKCKNCKEILKNKECVNKECLYTEHIEPILLVSQKVFNQLLEALDDKES